MRRVQRMPDRELIRPDDPPLLKTAAALAFPDGSMTASGLRSEAARGRLATERIAGRIYTTLRAIEAMRELCRTPASGDLASPASGSPPLSDERARVTKAAAIIAAERLKKRNRR